MNKQKEYLDKILERLKSETEFKVVPNDEHVGHKYDYYWKYPFSKFTTMSPYYPRDKNSNFHKHCRDIYGLSNEEIEDYILPNYYKWFKYNNPIYGFSNPEMLFKNTTINESEDKQKNFFDRVLERLLKETVITDSKITFPFAIFKQPELTGDSLLSVSTWIDGRWENHKYPSRFNKYCMDIYGLTYMESLGLWNSYMEIIEKEILNRLRKNKSNVATTWNMGRYDINESVDKTIIKDMIERNKNTITESEEITVKDSISLRKIIKYLKDKTKVVIEPFDIYDGYIIAPIGHGFRWDFYYKTLQPHGDFANEWWKEMQGVYGLTSKEVLIVMDVYMDFIWETLEKISDGR